MAIFSPNEYYDNTNNILDEMEDACVNMLYSLGMLDEANAYNKYMERKAAEQDDLLKKSEKYRNLANATISSKAMESMREKAKSYRDKANDVYEKESQHGYIPDIKYSGNIGTEMKAARSTHSGDTGISKTAKKAKQTWMLTHGNLYDDKLGNRKPGTFKTSEGLSAKKEQADFIREACYTILATLDELE